VYDIFKAGCSRIPVFDADHNDIVGIILAKDLIFVDPEDEIPVINFIDLFGRRPIFVWHDDKLGQTLATFRNERAHLALVRDVESQGEVSRYAILCFVVFLFCWAITVCCFAMLCCAVVVLFCCVLCIHYLALLCHDSCAFLY